MDATKGAFSKRGNLDSTERMTAVEFTRIGKRCFFGNSSTDWKHSFSRIFQKSWQSIHNYSLGRVPVPFPIAAELRCLDRMMDETLAIIQTKKYGTGDRDV